jgi:hypothetical protein
MSAFYRPGIRHFASQTFSSLNQSPEGEPLSSHEIVGCIAAFVLFLSGGTSATAQGTDQERQACTPDAFRLCGAYIPDVDRITACLRSNGPHLSKPCYDVFFHGPARRE